MNLSTTYMGIRLQNPLIAASSGLTSNINQIKKLAENGIGAIVLKSLFEEQINNEAAFMTAQQEQWPETADYIAGYLRSHSLENYLKLIKEAKASVQVPIIASISCFSHQEWSDFAVEIAKAGADGIEINIFTLPVTPLHNNEAIEKEYTEAIAAVCKKTQLPVAVKIGQHFTNIPGFVEKLYAHGAKAVVMFNRSFMPDIDLQKMQLTSAKVYSEKTDYTTVLRWIGIVSAMVPKIDIAASTGVHQAESAIKQILAGAGAVELCSALYQQGPAVIREMLKGIESFMKEKQFSGIDDFKGLLNYKKIKNPLFYERTQFMKYFGGQESSW